MKLLYLKGENFRSFAVFELDLNSAGLFSVTGPNGAGKSSIFGAVEWALFGGKRGAGTPPVLRQDADGDCRVELEFEIAGRVLKVVRIDSKDAWLTDVASGKELARGLSDTSHEVAVHLGLTQNMFCGTFYARQKEVQALSSSKSLAERRDQLERLLGIEHLRVAADLAERDRREQKALVDGLSEEAPDVDALRAEVERCEREAREAAPAVGELEAKVNDLIEQVKAAVAHIVAVTEQSDEHGSRRLAAEETAGELKGERTILDGLQQRLEAGRSAQVELSELTPVAARADEVSALEREMEMRRRNHVQIESLRMKERSALEELANATDMLRELGEAPALGDDASARFSAAQQELNELGEELRDAGEARQRADDSARIAAERHARAISAADIERELESLAEAEAQVERSRELWQKLRDERADVLAQLNHDIKHREALSGVGDTDAAVCPTCQRPLEGTLGALLADFEAAIAERHSEIKRVTGEMEQVAATEKQNEVGADRAQQLRARLASLVDAGDQAKLEIASEQTAAEAHAAVNREQEINTRYRALSKQIPALRTAAEQAAAASRRRAEALERKQRAQHVAAECAEQRSQIGSNGYDPTAHAALTADHERAQKAVRRCAALRENADAVQLLEGRIATQAPLVDELATKVERLRAQAAEVAPGENAREDAVAAHERLSQELEEGRRALDVAKQQVSMESQAVNAARTRLEDGRKMLLRVGRERRELEVQGAVAKALADYREHASQQARPALVRVASELLKQVSNGTYPLLRLTENYLLEVADGGRWHSIKRFSGGEQDLAALCLRLGLSRTLAGQRGAEQGFVILDEIFGSQDPERRQLLLQQLGELAEAEFQQMFVISHTDDVIEHCQMHIKVKRQNGVSVAEGPTT